MKAYLVWIALSLSIICSGVLSKDYIIFSISQEVGMGEKDEVLKKNYYVNIGKNQGVRRGHLLDVYRIFSKMDTFNNNARVDFRIKIGELKVIHSQDNASITAFNNLNQEKSHPMVDLKDFMIGDQVGVHLEKY